MNIIYIVQANSWNLNAGTPIIANQYALLAKNKNFNVCVLTPTNNKENFYKTLKKNDILYYSIPSITEWRLNGFDEKKNIIDEDLKLPFKPDLIHIIDWLHFDSQFLYSISNLKVPIIRHYCAFEDFCYFVHPIYKKKDNSLCNFKLNADICSDCISENIFKNYKFLKRVKSFLLNEKKKNLQMLKIKLKDRVRIANSHIDNIYNHLIFPSKSFADYFFTHAKATKPYSVIPHGIKLNKIINKKSSKETFNIIYTGGYAYRKGWEIVEKSFDKLLRKYPNKIKLRIYGDKNKIQKSKLGKFENIEFFDHFNHNEIKSVLSWADIGILPSLFETYGTIIREYLSFNVIPVVSNFFGANDIIKNNENGIILEKNCFEDLVFSVEKILNNKEFANKLRKNIFETKIISEDEEFDKINEIYNLYK